jgi:hypothetical protein
MKVKTNIRAGGGAGGVHQQQQQNSRSSIVATLVTYIPAISRCVGI